MRNERDRDLLVVPGVVVKVRWHDEYDYPSTLHDLVKYTQNRSEWVGDRKKDVLLGALHDLSFEFPATPEYFDDFETHDVNWNLVDQRFRNMIAASGFMSDDEEDDEIDAHLDDERMVFYCEIWLYEKIDFPYSCRFERNDYRYVEFHNHLPHNPKNWTHVESDMAAEFPVKEEFVTEPDTLLRSFRHTFEYAGDPPFKSRGRWDTVRRVVPEDTRIKLGIHSEYSSAVLSVESTGRVVVLDTEPVPVTNPQTFKTAQSNHTSIELADISYALQDWRLAETYGEDWGEMWVEVTVEVNGDERGRAALSGIDVHWYFPGDYSRADQEAHLAECERDTVHEALSEAFEDIEEVVEQLKKTVVLIEEKGGVNALIEIAMSELQQPT